MKKEQEQEQKYYEGTNIEIDPTVFYKDRETGVMITQREYVEMIKREAKELHRSINKCIENEDQYIDCDENGVNWLEKESQMEKEEAEKEYDEWYHSKEHQEYLKEQNRKFEEWFALDDDEEEDEEQN